MPVPTPTTHPRVQGLEEGLRMNNSEELPTGKHANSHPKRLPRLRRAWLAAAPLVPTIAALGTVGAYLASGESPRTNIGFSSHFLLLGVGGAVIVWIALTGIIGLFYFGGSI